MLRRLLFSVLSAAPVLFGIAACGTSDQRQPVEELTGDAMGTSFSVKIVAPPAELDHDGLRTAIAGVIATVEQQMSTYLADSELTHFNLYRGADWFDVSLELCQAVAESLAISAASGGAFDVTVGPLVNLWGFGPDGSISAPPDARRINALLDRVGSATLHADCSLPALRKDLPDIYVDLSAFAKGYGVDRLADLLDEHGLDNYLVEIGGELRVRGRNAAGEDWAVAIESPERLQRSVRLIARLSNAAVATSGDYRNYFEHDGHFYSHTIDPRTGYPVTHAAASVTVVADSAAYADAMATALLVLGPEAGIEFANREAIAAVFLVRENGGVRDITTQRFATEVNYQ